jgi:NTP pyrophosphatase (non-canonical NTP hydrolase)
MTINELVSFIKEFNYSRNWKRQASEVLLALVTEVGELAECYKWKSINHAPTPSEKEGIADELADIVIYVVCMAIAEGINLDDAITSKLEKNQVKYPLEGE